MVTEGVKEDVGRLAPLVLLDVVFDISKPLGELVYPFFLKDHSTRYFV